MSIYYVNEMIPRDRVLISLRHEEPDRVSIDLSSTHVSTLNPYTL